MKSNKIEFLLLIIVLSLCWIGLAFAVTAEERVNNSYFNATSFLEQAKVTENLPKKLALLRQALVLSPLNTEIKKAITDTKQQIAPNEAPLNLLQKESLIDYISTKSFVPFYIEDILIILFASTSLILLLKRRVKKGFITWLSIGLFTFCLSNKIFITHSRDGSLRLIKSVQEVNKTEGIALAKISARVSRDKQSDVTFLVPEGGELDIFANSLKVGDLVKIGFENGRTGWVNYDPSQIFLIVR